MYFFNHLCCPNWFYQLDIYFLRDFYFTRKTILIFIWNFLDLSMVVLFLVLFKSLLVIKFSKEQKYSIGFIVSANNIISYQNCYEVPTLELMLRQKTLHCVYIKIYIFNKEKVVVSKFTRDRHFELLIRLYKVWGIHQKTSIP